MKEEETILLLEKINKKLSLLVGQKIKERTNSIREQVSELRHAGMNYQEIAETLNISSSHAAKELSNLKKGGKNGKR